MTFEHQVQDLYVSRKVQIFSSLHEPEINLRHQQCHQRAATGSISITQNTNSTVHEVVRQKTVETEKKHAKSTKTFSEAFKEQLYHYFREK